MFRIKGINEIKFGFFLIWIKTNAYNSRHSKQIPPFVSFCVEDLGNLSPANLQNEELLFITLTNSLTLYGLAGRLAMLVPEVNIFLLQLGIPCNFYITYFWPTLKPTRDILNLIGGEVIFELFLRLNIFRLGLGVHIENHVIRPIYKLI